MKKNLLKLKIAILSLGIFFSINANAFTAVTSGNWSSAATWGGVAPGATVSNQDIIIPSGITVTLDQDVTFSGLLNSFSVEGTLSNTTTDGVIISQGSLAGSGTISINRISFSGLASSSFSGNLNLKRMVNSTLALGIAAIVNVTDTLELTSGSILLNANANLSMLNNSTIKVDDGSLSINGGVFNSGNSYNVMYVGSSKTTGIELNTTTLQHVYINMNDNNQSVTLGNNLIVNGNVTTTSGKIAIGSRALTLKGNVVLGSGSSFVSTATSTMIISGSGGLMNALMFDAGSSMGSITFNRTGQVKLGSQLNIAGYLNLMDGSLSLESGALLVMNAASTVHVEKGALSINSGTFTGTASYNAEYMGSVDVSSGTELTGSGLNNLTVDYAASSNKLTISNNTSVAGHLYMVKGKLALNGKNLMLNGTFSQNSGAVFVGDPASELHLNLTAVTNDTLFFDGSTSNSQSVSKLKINTSGSGVVVLGSSLKVANELNFTAGKIELSNGDLTILAAGSIVGYSDTKYVVTSQSASGSLVMSVIAGSSYVTFPIGTSSNYSPAHIQQASTASSADFNVRAMNTVLSNGISGSVSSNTLKLVNRTWFVTSAAAQLNANIKFGWVASAEVNGFNRANAYVAHYTSSYWDVTAASSATAAANNTYELSRVGLTSLSPFAVTEVGQALKVNEIVASNEFELYPNPSKDIINVKVINSTDIYKYELVDITGRTVLTRSNNNNLNTFDITDLEKGYYFIKLTNLSDQKINVSRFVRE